MSETTDRDRLAVIRTALANERTALAYVRTSLMIAATAATMFKFFPDLPAVRPAAIALLTLAALVLIGGGWRYSRLARRLR